MLKDERMKAVFGMVRENVTACDVGTDHAFIPIELILSGKCDKCIITDISAPSLQKGVDNAEKNGCVGKINAYCTNGTLGVEFDGKTDFIIAGMGGELIAQILDQDKRLRNPDFRFILQPMSRAEELRQYISENGFEIIKEIKVESMGRIYSLINAKYNGVPKSLSQAVMLLGFEKAASEMEKRYALRTLDAFEVKLNGLKSAQIPDLKQIEKITDYIITIKRAL